MNYWIVSDTHFGHDCLVQENIRPKKFEYKILNFLNKHVQKEDVFICLGDVSFKNDEFWHTQLTTVVPCKKWLIIGNHDSRSIPWYIEHGWDNACESMNINIFGKNILFSHKPKPESYGYDVNIHGHFHDFPRDKWEPELVAILNKKQYLICMETNGYQAETLKNIVKKIDEHCNGF